MATGSSGSAAPPDDTHCGDTGASEPDDTHTSPDRDQLPEEGAAEAAPTSTGLPDGSRRADHAAFYPTATRWADNDHYGHVNNVVYYAYLDTAVNGTLMSRTGVDTRELSAIGLVAETACRFLAPVGFPDALEVGVSVARLGNASITYRLAVFRADEDSAVAIAHYVHVYVDGVTRRSVTIPPVIRAAMAPLTRRFAPWQ